MFIRRTNTAQNGIGRLLIDSTTQIKAPRTDKNQLFDRNNKNISIDRSNILASLALEFSLYPKNIFIIGGTDLVGGLLICKLLQQTEADVYCLVEADSFEAAKLKIQQNLEVYGVCQEKFSSRIIPLIGNQGQPNLGISKEAFEMLAINMDTIYYCSSMVECQNSDSEIKADNNPEIGEVLRLSSLFKPKTLHIIMFPVS